MIDEVGQFIFVFYWPLWENSAERLYFNNIVKTTCPSKSNDVAIKIIGRFPWKVFDRWKLEMGKCWNLKASNDEIWKWKRWICNKYCFLWVSLHCLNPGSRDCLFSEVFPGKNLDKTNKWKGQSYKSIKWIFLEMFFFLPFLLICKSKSLANWSSRWLPRQHCLLNAMFVDTRPEPSQGIAGSYLIIVIFLHWHNFWKIKFTPKFTQ